MKVGPKGRIGSAHAIAFVALCASLGGGYAVAQDQKPAQPTVAYELGSADDARSAKGARSTLMGQLVVPKDSVLAVNAKLQIRAARKMKGSQVFTCRLGAVGIGDSSSVTLEADEAGTVALQAVGKPAEPASGNTQAIDLSCETARKKPYSVKDVKITAIALDGVEEVQP